MIYVLNLPYPISANRYWRTFKLKNGHVVTVVSAEAKAYKKTVAMNAALAGIKTPIEGRVKLEFWLYPRRPKDYMKRMRNAPTTWDDDVQCIDLDNVNKVLMDSLKNVAFQDDKWVRSLHGYRMTPDGTARLVVRVSKHIDLRPLQTDYKGA